MGTPFLAIVAVICTVGSVATIIRMFMRVDELFGMRDEREHPFHSFCGWWALAPISALLGWIATMVYLIISYTPPGC